MLALKAESCTGEKHVKDRTSVAFGANMSRTKKIAISCGWEVGQAKMFRRRPTATMSDLLKQYESIDNREDLQGVHAPQ